MCVDQSYSDRVHYNYLKQLCIPRAQTDLQSEGLIRSIQPIRYHFLRIVSAV